MTEDDPNDPGPNAAGDGDPSRGTAGDEGRSSRTAGEGDPGPGTGDGDPGPGTAGEATVEPAAPPTVDDLLDHLEALETTVDAGAERRQVREAIRVARRVDTGGTFGRRIVGFDRSDLAESLLGSVVFGIPMLVEGGTLEVGAFVATRPAYYLGTLVFPVLMVVAILYVADIQDVRIHRPLLGVVPRRLVGVLGVAFGTALVAMTAWGRVDWSQPRVALSQVTVCFVAMAIGAALGDIVPGS